MTCDLYVLIIYVVDTILTNLINYLLHLNSNLKA